MGHKCPLSKFGLRALGFRVLGFRVLGFRVEGIQGFRVQAGYWPPSVTVG